MRKDKYKNHFHYEMLDGEKFKAKEPSINIPKWVEPPTWFDPIEEVTSETDRWLNTMPRWESVTVSATTPINDADLYRYAQYLETARVSRQRDQLRGNSLWSTYGGFLDRPSVKKENPNKGPMRVIKE